LSYGVFQEGGISERKGLPQGLKGIEEEL